MALLRFNDIAVTGIAASVPKHIVSNRDYGKELFSEELLDKTIKTTNVFERRIADSSTCSSDLCFAAASNLLEAMEVDRGTIDLVLFVSQTPDYRIPATAICLQDRLGLSKTTAAFDINLGCTGYVYGLSAAFAYAHSGAERILLLAGDTVSKFISTKDKTTALLFGDAGSATLIEKKNNCGSAFFSLNSDGSGREALNIPGGGYRFPSSMETLQEREHEDGSVRSDEHLVMDGAEIFNFTIREVPKDIKALLTFAGVELEDIDFIFFHQANKFINDYLAKKIKYPADRVPYSLQKFGNTSGASIPLTMVAALGSDMQHKATNVLLSGYGIGLSWANALLEIENCYMADLIEV